MLSLHSQALGDANDITILPIDSREQSHMQKQARQQQGNQNGIVLGGSMMMDGGLMGNQIRGVIQQQTDGLEGLANKLQEPIIVVSKPIVDGRAPTNNSMNSKLLLANLALCQRVKDLQQERIKMKKWIFKLRSQANRNPLNNNRRGSYGDKKVKASQRNQTNNYHRKPTPERKNSKPDLGSAGKSSCRGQTIRNSREINNNQHRQHLNDPNSHNQHSQTHPNHYTNSKPLLMLTQMSPFGRIQCQSPSVQPQYRQPSAFSALPFNAHQLSYTPASPFSTNRLGFHDQSHERRYEMHQPHEHYSGQLKRMDRDMEEDRESIEEEDLESSIEVSELELSPQDNCDQVNLDQVEDQLFNDEEEDQMDGEQYGDGNEEGHYDPNHDHTYSHSHNNNNASHNPNSRNHKHGPNSTSNSSASAYSQHPRPKSNHHNNNNQSSSSNLNIPRRFRRTAHQIQRHYRCQVLKCQKSYGSQGSLNQHYKLKHPEIYAKLPNVIAMNSVDGGSKGGNRSQWGESLDDESGMVRSVGNHINTNGTRGNQEHDYPIEEDQSIHNHYNNNINSTNKTNNHNNTNNTNQLVSERVKINQIPTVNNLNKEKAQISQKNKSKGKIINNNANGKLKQVENGLINNNQNNSEGINGINGINSINGINGTKKIIKNQKNKQVNNSNRINITKSLVNPSNQLTTQLNTKLISNSQIPTRRSARYTNNPNPIPSYVQYYQDIPFKENIIDTNLGNTINNMISNNNIISNNNNKKKSKTYTMSTIQIVGATLTNQDGQKIITKIDDISVNIITNSIGESNHKISKKCNNSRR